MFGYFSQVYEKGMDVLDNTSIDFLEGLDDENPTLVDYNEPLSEEYVLGLEDLNYSKTAKQEQLTKIEDSNAVVAKQLSVPQFDPFLDETDVSLRDVIDKVFRRSDRPFVIIRDDKIEYANQTFLNLLECPNIDDILHQKFLKLVAKEDWDFLAKNIGEMLTNNAAMEINMISGAHKIIKAKFDAMYIFDKQHFTFILIGERLNRRAANTLSMYDSLTGLPNFYLFEDRVQVIVNYENYKDVRQKRNMIAVACIALDNFEAFKSIGLHDLILRKLAEKLMLTLRKTYTVGSGLKYHFWILLPDVMDEESLKLELSKIQAIFREPVADNFTNHEISASIGVSVFPEPATSAKKLIEQAILSLQRAQKEGGNRMQIFGL